MSAPILSANDLKYLVGSRVLFENLSISVLDGDKIALVGGNGTGKSTLMKLLFGTLTPEEGNVVFRSGLKVGFVEQYLPDELQEKTPLELVLDQMSPEEQSYESYKAEILLEDLGISRDRFNIKTKSLSGGQVNLVMLARAIVHNPDLLFLDEPTNHLDLDCLLMIENYLKNYFNNSIVLISHDSDFLDAVTNRTVFLQNQKLFSFSLPYTKARDELIKVGEELKKKQADELKEINRLKTSAKRLATWGKDFDNESLSKKAKSMEKKIEKLEQEKTEVLVKPQYKLGLDLGETKSNCLIRVENFNVKVPKVNKELYHIEKLYINRGDRVILLGKNGTGKSTLIKDLVKEFSAQMSKQIYFNPQVTLGYYDQEQDQLDKSLSIFEQVRKIANCDDNTVKKELISAGFTFDDLSKKVKVLSGGEKARILFILLKINRPNFIILDEPTNHIDLYGREELLQQLTEQGATILVTTHDRKFAKSVGTKFVAIENGVLAQINSLDQFYQNEADSVKQFSDTIIEQIPDQHKVEIVSNSDDVILAEIMELEEKLEHNLNQKKKFQKPLLQKEWKSKLNELYALLDER